MIERQHLLIIKEVKRLGSVTAAAGSLNLSQSAVSHAIAKLESRFNVKLWRRKGNALVYSRSGEFLLTVANKMLSDFEYAERVLNQFALGHRGVLRIGMECHPCEKWLMSKINHFLRTWPDVDVELKNRFLFDGIAALKANEIDLLVTPDPTATEGIEFSSVFDYNLCAVVSSANALAEKQFVLPEDFANQTLFTVPVSLNRLDVFTRFLDPAGVTPGRHQTVETTDMMMQLVGANRGISVLPEWIIAECNEELGLVCLQLGRKGINKSVNIGVRKEDSSLDFFQSFIELALV